MISEQVKSYVPKIREFLKGQPVKKAWLFGSCSRGEETSDSDIDLMVEYDDSEKLVNLMTISRIATAMENLLGRRIDLVESEDLLTFAQTGAQADKILIYER